MRIKLGLAIVVLAVAVGGCSSAPTVTSAPVSVAPTPLDTSAQTSVSLPSTDAAATISAGATPPIGSAQKMTIGEAEITVTTFGMKTVPPAQYEDLPAGLQKTALDVQVCSNFAGTIQAMDRWVLIDGSNGRYEPQTMMDAVAPEYPYSSVDTLADECIRGWIMFKTRVDAPITTIRYQTSNGYTLKWSV